MLLAEGVRVWGTARDPARLPAARPGFTPVALDLADAAGRSRRPSARRTARPAGSTWSSTTPATACSGRLRSGILPTGGGSCEAMLIADAAAVAPRACGACGRAGRGALVNVSSLAVEFPLPFMSGYNAAKAGLSAFSESLMVEVAGTGVIVIDFRPGDYRTGFNQADAAQPRRVSPPPARAGVACSAPGRAGGQPAGGARARRAAADLRRALRRGRSGTVRSGTFFQARLAPLLARLASARGCGARFLARYFGSS